MPRGSLRHRDRALYVEIFIAAPLERVWELTQDPAQHARWDGRFSAIHPTVVRDNGAQEFRYELGLGVHTIRGTGVSLGEKRAAAGTRTSALLFTTDDPLSPLGTGRGYWRYIPEGDGVRFITGYDYEPGWGWLGRIADPLVTRRFVWWLTAWSFDRLRIWAEDGTEPERIGWWRGWLGGVRARAGNCLSRPEARAALPRGAGGRTAADAAVGGFGGASGGVANGAGSEVGSEAGSEAAKERLRIMDGAPSTLAELSLPGVDSGPTAERRSAAEYRSAGERGSTSERRSAAAGQPDPNNTREEPRS